MLWLAAATLAAASVTFERPVEDDEKEALEPDPQSVQDSVQRDWRLKAQRRAVWAGIDAAVRAQAPAVEACAREGSLAALGPVEAEVKLAVDITGTVKVRPGKPSDPVLAACVVTTLHGKALPVLMGRSAAFTYTVRWDVAAPADAALAAPAAAAVGPGDGAAAPADGTAAPAASEGAFAPLVDAERGFGAFPWGARAADYEVMSATSSKDGTTFYARLADYGARWFGVPVTTVRYAFGRDGFYALSIAISGSTGQYQLREALVARFGPSRWDTRANAYYWRGERVLVQLQPLAGGDDAVVTWLDIGRARASGLADRLPGDKDDPTSADNKRRMPRIFKDD